MSDRRGRREPDQADEKELRKVVERFPQQEKPVGRPEHQYNWSLPPISFVVTITIWMALNAVLPGSGFERTIQITFYAGAAGLLSYVGNKVSIHKGALLAARGDYIAIAGTVIWFIAFSIMVGTLSFTGMTYKIVSEAILRDAGQAIVSSGRYASRTSIIANRVVPAIESGRSDVLGIVRCEGTSGCVSGRAGIGPEVAKLQQIAGKYEVLRGQYRTGDRNRKRLAAALVALSKDYEETLNKPHGSWGEKRAALLEIYLKAERVVMELETAVPTVAALGFVQELRSLNVAPAKPGMIDVAARLASNADRLEVALGEVKKQATSLPPFPQPPGIAAGWRRLDKTWPLAIFAFLLEGAVIYLWFSVFREYRALQDWLAMRRSSAAPGANGGMTLLPPEPGPSDPNSGGVGEVRTDFPELDSEPIDGPHGWSGRSRFNKDQLNGGDD